MTEKATAAVPNLMWMGGESYDEWKKRFLEDYYPTEPIPSDEQLAYSYQDDCRFVWEDLIGELTTLIEENFSGYWWAEVRNFGWQSLHGTSEFTAGDGQEFLRKLLPKTNCHFKIFLDKDMDLPDWTTESVKKMKGLRIQNYHHDSPMGREWYYVLDVGDLTQCGECEKWFPDMDYYMSKEVGCAQEDPEMCQTCGEEYYEEEDDTGCTTTTDD